MKVNKIRPIGYCFGVISAIKKAIEIRKDYPNNPIYVFGLLMHNDAVISLLNKHNIETIDTKNIDIFDRLNEFKEGDIVIFTAHGHPKKYEEPLIKNNILFFDTTCENVKRNNQIIIDNASSRDVIYIGTTNHPETIAALSNSKRVYLYDKNIEFDYSQIVSSDPLVINQTTLSLFELGDIHKDIISHIPGTVIVEEICNATRIRQEGILKINDDVDLIIIVGSNKSSNSKKLFEVAKINHPSKKVIMVDTLNDIKAYDLSAYKNAIIASGTSTSLEDIDAIEEYVKGA